MIPFMEPEVYSIQWKGVSIGLPSREKFLHERRRNRDKQRAISTAIHFQAEERQTQDGNISLSVHTRCASRKMTFVTIELCTYPTRLF